MDSETSNCCCFLLRLLILVQKTAHARGAVREPRGLEIGADRVLFESGGAPFLKLFPGTFFSPTYPQNCLKMEPKLLKKHTLLHNTRDLVFCCYLQHFVAIEPPKTTQKVLQNRIKKSAAF